MSLYSFLLENEYSLLPFVMLGWDELDDFYIELGFLNVGIGVNFG